MPFDDSNTNNDATVTNPGTPVPAQPATPPSAPATNASPNGQPAPGGQQQPQPRMITNPGAQPQPQDDSQHPLVKRANVLRSVAETIAGGPSYRVNDDGTRTPLPLSGKQIGFALALEALSGGLAGLAAGRGRGPGAAGVAGMQQGENIAAQRKAQEQQDFENRAKALARNATIFETNSRTLLNAAESEKYGSDAIDKLVAINRASGVLDVDPETLDNDSQPMTQAELMDAMQKGTISSTDQLGPIAGRVEVSNPDGTKRWEATHLVIRDPNAPTTLTQEDWDRYAAGHVRGFPVGTKLGPLGVQVPLRMKQSFNEVLAAHTLADYRLRDVRDTLAGTSWADKVPASVDFSKPGIDSAMQRFQKYVSHSNMHGMDVYESLQQMGTDKRNSQTGQMQPNPDAKFVDAVADAFGGWPVLKAVHDKLQSDTAGQKSAAEARARGDEEVSTAKRMIPIKAATAGAEEKARNAAKPEEQAFNKTDALGFTPNLPQKEYSKRYASFKKDVGELNRTEGQYQQFQDITKNIAAGNYSGADSIVGLFDAIGISATPLAGRGFRVNQNVISEHAHARGWLGSLQQKLESVKNGEVITPQQLKDYAGIATQARQSQYISLVNQAHNAGLNADFVLPTGNGQAIDPATARIFVQLTGSDLAKAAAAMRAKGWTIQ